MKTIKFALAAIMVFGASSLFAQKFARVDAQAIIAVMPETAKMQTDMQAYIKDLQQQMDAMNTEYQTKVQDYQKNATTMPDATRQLKEKDLNDLRQRMQDYNQMAQDDSQKKQNDLMTPIYAKAKAAIDKVAKAGGYTAVFDTSAGALVYFDEATLTDLAPAVHQELGITEAQAKAALDALTAQATQNQQDAAGQAPAPAPAQ